MLRRNPVLGLEKHDRERICVKVQHVGLTDLIVEQRRWHRGGFLAMTRPVEILVGGFQDRPLSNFFAQLW